MQTTSPPRIVYCRCAYAQVVPPAVKDEVLRRLNEADVAFDAVADLCELSAKADPALKQLTAGGPVRIAACFPRAVRWLFHAAGAPLPATGVEVLNMRTESAENVAAALLSQEPIATESPSVAGVNGSNGQAITEASS